MQAVTGNVRALRLTPRRWQEDALSQWLRADRRGIVEVVTGAGKTAFAEICMAEFWSRNPAGAVIILVPTLALIDQWFVSLTEDLGLEPGEIATYTGESHPSAPAAVNLVTLNTARDGIPGALASPRLLIVDECHRAASSENRRALEGEYVATLGLSATPERQYDTGLEDVLVPMLGPVIYKYDYRRARADGILVPFHLVNAHVSLLPPEQGKFEQLTRRVARLMRQGDQDDLVAVLRRRARVVNSAKLRVPAAVKLVETHRGQRCIVFHESIAAADEIVRQLAARKNSVIGYHTGIGPITRRENLRLYRRGVFDVLVTCRALDEGVNVPDTSVGVIASATASIRQRIQRLGRVLRPAGGKKSAVVYTIYATDLEEKRLVSETGEASGASSVRWIRLRLGNV